MTETSYKNWNSWSDKALAEHIGRFIKTQRMEQNKTQEMIAHAAGISRSTLSLLERGETVTVATLLQVLRVLDQLHVLDVFSVERSISPMQLVEEERKQRKRARGKNDEAKTKSDW